MQVHSAELEAGGRKGLGRIDEHDFFQAEASSFDIPHADAGPEVIDGKEKHDVVGEAEGVLEEAADLAPRRIGDDPVDALLPGEEVAVSFDLTPKDGSSGSRIGCATRLPHVVAQGAEKDAVAGAGFDDKACGLKMFYEAPRQPWGRLDFVVTEIVTMGWSLTKTGEF
jgi:hypothetical protein